MNIRLQIEKLVLEGLPVTPGQGEAVQAALEEELAGLLRRGGLGRFMAGGAVPSLSVPLLKLSPGGQPVQFGRQIARALYAGLAAASPSLANHRHRGGHRTGGSAPAN